MGFLKRLGYVAVGNFKGLKKYETNEANKKLSDIKAEIAAIESTTIKAPIYSASDLMSGARVTSPDFQTPGINPAQGIYVPAKENSTMFILIAAAVVLLILFKKK